MPTDKSVTPRPSFAARVSKLNSDAMGHQDDWDEWGRAMMDLAMEADDLEAENVALKADARRYREWIRAKVYAHHSEHSGRDYYQLCVILPQREETNIMRGSIAEHLDNEIDFAIGGGKHRAPPSDEAVSIARRWMSKKDWQLTWEEQTLLCIEILSNVCNCQHQVRKNAKKWVCQIHGHMTAPAALARAKG